MEKSTSKLPTVAIDKDNSLSADDSRLDAVDFDYDRAEAERLHEFVPNAGCGTTCDRCDETREWHDKRDQIMRRRRALMPDYDQRLKDWLS